MEVSLIIGLAIAVVGLSIVIILMMRTKEEEAKERQSTYDEQLAWMDKNYPIRKEEDE